MPRIRVMVVDDSVVIRRMVADILAADPEIEVVGTAANGRIALQKIPQLSPDLVTLDIEMPELNGLETVTEIRKRWKQLPIIMFSTLSESGATATLDALARGATDYVTKPSNVGSLALAQQRISDDLIPRIKQFCGHVLRPGRPSLTPPRPRLAGVSPETAANVGSLPASRPVLTGSVAGERALQARNARGTGAIDVLAIGCSTGGPNALVTIIPQLPADMPVPVVITQHMPPVFTKFLADRLSAMSRLPVREAAGGEVLLPGTVWIAPGNHHLVLERRGGRVVTTLNQDPQENSCRPSVAVMLRSVVSCYEHRVLSVILTGMGNDGLLGCELVHRVGGRVLAQDEASSVVWGMPGYVARSGVAEGVLPLDDIAGGIMDRIRASRAPKLRSTGVA
jgi:two-component system, chemotaxis family, protein-glutamate methylesterase/glutaminase